MRLRSASAVLSQLTEKRQKPEAHLERSSPSPARTPGRAACSDLRPARHQVMKECRMDMVLPKTSPKKATLNAKPPDTTVGALIIRTGFWGIVYYSYNKEPEGLT